jgi:hypothetical protein
MKAIYILPEDIGAGSDVSEVWINFCLKLGYDKGTTPACVIITNILLTH